MSQPLAVLRIGSLGVCNADMLEIAFVLAFRVLSMVKELT